MMRPLALLLAATCSTPGLAQTFTGPRVQAVATLDNLRFDLADVNERRAGTPLQRGKVGYDAAISSSLVAGGEIEVDRTGIADDRSGLAGSVPGGRQNLSMSGRIGAHAGRALVYGKVGYANLRIDDPLVSYDAAAPSLRVLNGVLIGLGTEVAVTDRAFIDSEWRYTAYQAGLVQTRVLTGIGFRF